MTSKVGQREKEEEEKKSHNDKCCEKLLYTTKKKNRKKTSLTCFSAYVEIGQDTHYNSRNLLSPV